MSEQAAVAGIADQSSVRASMQFRAAHSSKAAVVIVMVLAVFVFTLRGRVPLQNLLLWMAMMLSVILWRGWQARAIRKRLRQASAEELRRAEYWFLASIAIGSYVTGSAFWLIALHGDDYVKLLVTMVSMCMMMGGFINATTNVRHRALRASGNVGQGILFWAGLGTGGQPHWVILAAYAALLYMALEYTREHLRQFDESLRIRNENAALLAQLAGDKQVIEGALKDAKLANESKSRFLAAASHDLRQPLHALTMFLGTMTFHVTTDDARRLLGRIKDTVRVLEEQFNSLLDLSKFDVGAVVAETKSFRLDLHIERLIDELRPIAEAKQLMLAAQLAPAVARSDPLLIGRVLRNLLDNAVKYTASGSVSIRVTPQPASFLVEVSDTGPGIAADQQARIFDEYVQLANPGRQRRRGVGLGLAIVKRIDQLLGLSLALQSSLGAGAHFSFVVPAAAADDVDSHLRTSGVGAAAVTTFTTSASIWILDDDPVALESLHGQLLAWGASVTAFSDPEALLAELRAGAALPNWICTDDMLGASLSGLETAQILSRQFGFGRVCLITGNTEPARLAELRSSGFPVIVKPATPERLIATIGS